MGAYSSQDLALPARDALCNDCWLHHVRKRVRGGGGLRRGRGGWMGVQFCDGEDILGEVEAVAVSRAHGRRGRSCVQQVCI